MDYLEDSYKEKLAYKQHKKYVDKLFEKGINGQNEKLYIKILERPDNIKDSSQKEQLYGDKSEDVVGISLITQGMLEYDQKVFEILKKRNSGLNKSDSNNIGGARIKFEDGFELEEFLYRPYFFEFIVKMDDLTDNEKIILSDENVIGKWIEASFVDIDDEVSEDVYAFPGQVLFSASPFRMKGRKLIIQDKNIRRIPGNINDWIKTMYNTSSSIKTIDKIKGVLDKQFTNPKPSDYKVRIYNVGDGNCIYIHCNNGRRVLFDIGHNCNPYSKDWREDSKITRTELAIRRMKPHTTILSHWDLDHVIGVVFAKQWIFRQPWIAPDLNVLPNAQVSVGALRVAKYLELYNRLFLVSERNHLIYSTDSLKIWSGKGKASGTVLTETNNAGLIIEINKKDILTLLPGDCEYKALPDDLDFSNRRFNNLVVPHHCSKMDTRPVNYGISALDNAIISVSIRNVKRPDFDHKNHLQNSCNYSVRETGDYFCIEIPSLADIRINPEP